MRKGRLVPKMSKSMQSSSLDDLKKYVKPLDKFQNGGKAEPSLWSQFEDSDVGKFIDAKGLRKEKDYFLGLLGYGDTAEEGRRFALDAAATVNPIPDFINAADHAQQGKLLDAGLYAGAAILPGAAGPIVNKVKPYIKGAANRVMQIPGVKAIKSGINKSTGVYVDHLSGASKGILELMSRNSRPITEIFPMTKAQRELVEAKQDAALKEGVDFVDRWIYEGTGGDKRMRDAVYDRIDNLTGDLPAYESLYPKSELGLRGNPLSTTQNKLADNRSIFRTPTNNLSDEASEYLARKRGLLLGVNMGRTGESITLRNSGLYYRHPQDIFKTVVHEGGHTFQDLPLMDIDRTPWDSHIQMYSPDTKYFVANPDTEIGRRFEDALKTPKKGRQSWTSSPKEVHSELMASRAKLYQTLQSRGYSAEEAIQRLQKGYIPDLELIRNDMAKRHSFFKRGTDADEKINLLKILPGVAGVATVGTGLKAAGNRDTTMYETGGQVVTDYDRDWDYKKEGDTVFTKKKGADKWIQPKKGSVAEKAIQNKVFGLPVVEPKKPLSEVPMIELDQDSTFVPFPKRVPITPKKTQPKITIGDMLPDLPDVTLPEIKMPEISRPQISLPDMPDMPDINLPEFSVPDMPSLPKMSMPDISMPDMPNVSMPDMPDVEIPSLELYENLGKGVDKVRGIADDIGEYGEDFVDYAKDVVSDAVSSGKSNFNSLKDFLKGELEDYAEDFAQGSEKVEDLIDSAIDKVKDIPELLKSISDVEEEIVKKSPAPAPVKKETFEEMLVRSANNLNTGHILAGDQMYRIEDGEITKRMETIVGKNTTARKGATSKVSYATIHEEYWYNKDGSLREFRTPEGLKTGPEIKAEGLYEKYGAGTPAGIYEFTNEPLKSYKNLGYSSDLKALPGTPENLVHSYFKDETGKLKKVTGYTGYHPFPSRLAKVRQEALDRLDLSNELSAGCIQNSECDNRDMGILLQSNPSMADSLIILNPAMGELSEEAVKQLAVKFDLAQSKKEKEDVLKLLAQSR